MLRPSRRIPKAFARPSSRFSLTLARALYGGRRSRSAAAPFARARRRGRRSWHSALNAVKRMRRWSVAVLLVTALATTFVLLFSPLLRIASMRVSRQDSRLDIEEIQQLLLPFFGTHLLFLSPRTVERAILTAYPDVTSVRVAKRLPNELHLTLYTDPVVATVSLGAPEGTERSFIPLSASGTYRYLTAHGVYLEYAIPLSQQESDEEHLELRVVDWAVKPVHRQTLLPPAMVDDMQRMRTLLLQSFGQRVRFVTAYIRAREYHVTVEHSSGPRGRSRELTLWLDAGDPIVQQLDHYREFLRAGMAERVEEYVDLRLHDRVVYR